MSIIHADPQLMKTQVLEAIGEAGLKRPAEVGEALAANGRLKYYFSLLQMATLHADNPDQFQDSMRKERLEAGVAEAKLDEVVGGSQRQNGYYQIQGCSTLLARIARDLRIMAKPLLTDAGVAQRTDRLLASLPVAQNECIPGRAVNQITQARRGKTDSIHRLVMDLHKALIAMRSELAEERIDGAAVYQIQPGDRALIEAFMTGVNRTSALKFSHPGLATTAARSENTLVIQNDIGETDAHVIVVRIEGPSVRLTYSDVHPERIEFLRDMIQSRYPVIWENGQTRQVESLASGAPFYVAEGQLDAKTSEELLAYLEFLGAKLVFLIDWNRARKQLRGFLRSRGRFELLSWAAQEEIGHRGFLEAGGARLINQAIERTAGSAMHFGDRLCDVLGDEAAQSFLQFVFRSATETLRENRSQGLLRDRIRAELQAHFSSEGTRLLEVASEHAGIILEIASLLRDSIRGQNDPKAAAVLARRARSFEHDADQLVLSSREAVERRPEYNPLFRMVEAADDAADELEEVAFLLELLMGSRPEGAAREALNQLADILLDASEEWIKALAHALQTGREAESGHSQEAEDFLAAVDRLFALEHRADDAERDLVFAAVKHARGFRQLHLYTQIANSLEEAADALKAAGLIARDYLLGSVLAKGL